MPKFSTNNLLDIEGERSRYADLRVDQLDLKKENIHRDIWRKKTRSSEKRKKSGTLCHCLCWQIERKILQDCLL